MEEPVPTPKAGLTVAVQTGMGDPGVNSVSTVCYIKRISLHMYNMYMFSVSTVQQYTLKYVK